MKKIVVSLAVGFSLISTPVFAWGDREQGILTGVAGLWVFQQLNKVGQQSQAPVIVQQPPVIVQTQPSAVVQRSQQYCESTQVIDQFGQARMITFCYVR